MDWRLLLVIGLAGVLRLLALGLIEFKADEALTVSGLRQFVEQPYLIQAGLVSSTGARNFPLFHYLLTPISLISTDPKILSGCIGFVNAMMVAWFFLVTKREFGNKIAIAAALLMASAPFAVLYSRKIWAQDLIPLFAVPIYDLLWRLKRKPKDSKLVGLLFGLLTLQAQLHASGIFFGLAMMIYLLVKKIKLTGKAIGIGAMGLVFIIPYLELQWSANPRFPDLVAYRQVAAITESRLDLSHLVLPFKYLTSFNWVEVMGKVDFDRFVSLSPAVAISWLAGIVVIGVIIGGIWATIKEKRDRVLPMMVFGLVGLYVFLGVPARLHYYQVLTPYIALLAAVGLTTMLKKQPMFLKPIMGLIIGSNIIFTIMFWRYLELNHGVNGDYGRAYKFNPESVDQIVEPYLIKD